MSATVTVATMSKRKCYDVTFKLRVANCIEIEFDPTARDFSVNAKRIRVWCSQKDSLLTTVEWKVKEEEVARYRMKSV